MTKGSITKNLVTFAIPLFFGQLLQQLYNVVDSVVVGNVLGKEALAAVSTTGSLIFLMVGFINGLFMGNSVIIGKSYGAKDYKSVEVATHTGITFAIIMGLVMTVWGYFFTPILLGWMGTPADVMQNSVLYFKIYFLGGLGNILYSACCGVFQAMGDSKRPLHYLMVSTVLNTILDITFVKFLGFGIGGAAFATIIAQFVSAFLAFSKLTRVDGPHRIYIRKLRINKDVLARELRIGFPTGIQNSVIAIGNVVVQSNINAFGSVAMAACGSYFKLEGFVFLPITCMCMALTTFVSQNLGAGEIDRVKKGSIIGSAISIGCAELIGVLVYIYAPVFLRMFSNEEVVLGIGTTQARTESLFFCLLALSHCLAGIYRGAGKTTIPMIVMLSSWCLLRITYITIIVRIIPVVNVIFWAYPLTWSVSSIVFIIYYFKGKWLRVGTAV
ncbi:MULTISPECIES: MATE family efflux transporter [unclassified Butyrivibrio]|jgi:putative MATE family efflux protein|uniref:MATE family efflux transporter n=1 Tax=unclassified Butyrivibrio TaxID=2639466 RepID=UPI0003B73988|nr:MULTISPECIES: MATE family efflux transporter [unclassified Butyrivibrio]MDC7292311.1 MATE family efflux transporter [Butyrivibrio sp. DSM 10294]